MTDAERLPDGDINAYVDGELDTEGAAEVEAWFATHPDDAARVHALKLQKLQLHQLYDADAEAPLPDGLLESLDRTGRSRWLPDWRQLAAGIVLLALGGAGGWWGQDMAAALTDREGTAFVQRAFSAYSVYAHDTARPVEISAAPGEEALLESWLSERLGRALKTPDLASKGFRLIGGRLLVDHDAPAALLMYEDQLGRRVTLYMRRSMDVLDRKFRIAAEHGMVAFYWTDGRFAYALTGEMPSSDLLMLAQMVVDDMDSKTS